MMMPPATMRRQVTGRAAVTANPAAMCGQRTGRPR